MATIAPSIAVGTKRGMNGRNSMGFSEPDDCGGTSQSFVEGCRAYAKEQSESDDNQGDNDEPSD
jgi:hypothetical protein